MNTIRISVVSYTNSKPFIHGLQHTALADQIALSLDIPATCAEKLITDQVDIGLIPVATIPQVPNAHIVSSFCIGSVGAVNSVFILSNVPVQEIRTLKLDPESRTSNNLAKVLLKFHFKVQVELVTDPTVATDAIVLIGDRTFTRKADFPYVYDMGQEWFNFTGLPFVYAAWVANKPIPEPFIAEFNQALKAGLDHREELIRYLPPQEGIDLYDYLFHKLDFELDRKKREALDTFLAYIGKL